MKRAKGTIDGMNPKTWFDYMFDHTTVIAPDDPELATFQELDRKKVIQLRILEGPVGAEKFAKFVFDKVNAFILNETNKRVRVVRVEFFENRRNSAIYEE